MKNEMTDIPFLVNSYKRRSSNENKSNGWIHLAAIAGVGSIFLLIILVILLALPIIVFVIGTRYRDPRYCPIEPRISLFLLVNGGVSLGSIIFAIILWILIAIAASRRSSLAVIIIMIFRIIFGLLSIFSFIWVILGSVWTFRVHNRVIHEYDRINNFYLYTYCHPVLYKFTFAYLIISYVLLAFQCCYTCVFSSSQRK